MKLSVVIPLYNKEKHIEHTIQTVLAQTYGDFELLVVDDGSTDDSVHVVSSIRDDRIRLIQKENEGETKTRNVGVELSQGDYVAFIDADDEWKPGFLEEIVALIEKYPHASLFATALSVHERNGEEYTLEYPGIPNDGSNCLIQNYFVSSLYYSPISSSSVCVSKKAFQELGGFPEGIKNGGDLDLWCRMALKFPFAYSSRPSAVYRRDSENMASRSTTTPSYFPFLTEYKPEDNQIISSPEPVERYILQRQFDAVSASLFVIRNRTMAKQILKEIKYHKYNVTKYFGYKMISVLPQMLIDEVYRLRLKSLKQYDV